MLNSASRSDRVDFIPVDKRGRKLPSGIYIYVVETKKGEKIKGKFGIIR